MGKQKIYVEYGKFVIERSDYGVKAYTSYHEGLEDLYDEIKSSVWTPHNKDANTGEYKYFARTKNGKTELLHQLIFKFFNGEEKLNELYNANFVIEHIDNNGLNCCFDNLAICSHSNNNRKGKLFDKTRGENFENILLDIRYCYIHGRFQINIILNDPIPCFVNGEELDNVFSLDLLYDKTVSYAEILEEAQNILDMSLKHKKIDISNSEYKFITFQYRLPPNVPYIYWAQTRPVIEWL